MNRTETLRKIQVACGYNFKNSQLLIEALTHDSNRVNDRTLPTYQRLEFLGDSVLHLVVSEYLFRNNPEFSEGQLSIKRKELTEAVKQVQIADKLKIQEHVVFGQSVQKDLFSKYHSFVESLIGAVYIDGGLDAAKQVIHHLWELSDKSSESTNDGYCVLQ